MSSAPVEMSVHTKKAWPASLVAVLLAVLALVAVAFVYVAMWALPGVLVDGDAYNLPNGQPDHAAAQDAYNSVRVPIGVTTAAFLAAAAAAAGVWMNARTVAVSRESLAQVRANDEERRQQWRSEQLHSRFLDAAKQLGDGAASVRLAGVLSMARLADDWEDQRQSCVDVLTAYYRMPLDREDVAERQVRRLTLDEILRRLTIGSSPSWSECHLDLSGALIEGLRHPGPVRITSMVMESATISGFSFLDQVFLDGAIHLDGATIGESFRMLATMGPDASIWMADVTVVPSARLHVGIWRSDSTDRDTPRPGFVHVNMNDLEVLQWGKATISLWGCFSHERFLYGNSVSIAGGELRLIAREGEVAAGAVQLPELKTTGSGRVLVNASLEENVRAELDTSTAHVLVLDSEDLGTADHDPRKPIFV
ncbi:hypothetical protein ACIA03_28040 [Nocardioides sp. NPDC051685]|uniref:hypothetical protein n=1 Tax=Nocardioides sp. NPDC051685 TaxID=3364334 RepID=UPI003789EB7D